MALDVAHRKQYLQQQNNRYIGDGQAAIKLFRRITHYFQKMKKWLVLLKINERALADRSGIASQALQP
jgi:uncharacterized protein YjiS (DUF1127 family)